MQKSLIVLGMAAALIATPASAEDWMQFGGPRANFQTDHGTWPPRDGLAPVRRWQQTLGAGMSGVVTKGPWLYTMYLQPFSAGDEQQPEAKRSHEEVVVALDRRTGEEKWRYRYDAGWSDVQEAFGGRARAPQATPAIVGENLITLGFTGHLKCFDRETGRVAWAIDLVQRFGAPAVQFGYAASPLPWGDQVVVLAGGERGGLVCLDAASGEVVWNVPCAEASYATPVLWQVAETTQIVFVTRKDVVGVDAASGEMLWRYDLPQSGLTNVPTPQPTPDGGLILSGQGIGGTRRLNVARREGTWLATEGWFNRAQFFYCNASIRDGLLLGCDGDLLLAIDAASGATGGRWRGYADSNLALAGEHLVILDGKGNLTVMECLPDQLRALTRHEVLEERCWTPPTLVGNLLYCRGGDMLICVDLANDDADSPQRLSERTIPRGKLAIERGQDQEIINPVAPRPSAETHLGENGLLYVEIAVQNNTTEFVDTIVRGPDRHPFSYGIPFAAGKFRIEKWPVGTQLFTAGSEPSPTVLLEIKASDAGRVLKFAAEPESQR